MDEINDETHIVKLGFTVRTKNCLISEGIENLGYLMCQPDKILLKIRNLGPKSLKEINAFKEEYKKKTTEKDKDAEASVEKDFLSTARSFFREQADELLLEISERTRKNELELIKVRNIADYIQCNIRELNEQARANNMDLQNMVKAIETKQLYLERAEKTLFSSIENRINEHYYVLQKAFNDYVQSKASEDKDHLSNKISILESKIAELESRMASLFFAGEK